MMSSTTDIKLTVSQCDALKNVGIVALNDMQQSAIGHCRKERNMVLLSPTGTGKTLAYLLPLLERLESEREGLQAIVVLPSRELVRQVYEVWRSMSSSFRMIALYGGRPVSDDISQINGVKPSVAVGTPGRLLDHLAHGSLSVEKCDLLVIDEFDKCLEMGFHDEMKKLLSLLPSVQSRWLLSATDAAEIPDFAGADVSTRLDFRTEDVSPVSRTSYYKLSVTPDNRLEILFKFLCGLRGEPAIVFCNFRETVEEVRSFLAKNRMPVSAYHGSLEQRERELALYRFTSGCVNVLVCTDLAARGLDIKDVGHVVHFQRPMTVDVFTHRNGRTARWDADGAVYMLAYPEHPMPEFLPQQIIEYRISEKNVQPELPQWMAIYIGKGKRDKLSRGDIAGFFMKKGGLKPNEIGLISLFDRYSYVAVSRSKARAVLALLNGEKIKGMKTVFEPLRG